MDKKRAVEILRRFRDLYNNSNNESLYLDGTTHREVEDALNLAIDILRRR